MKLAIEEANLAKDRGEVPVGAIIIDENSEVIAKTGNRVRELNDPTAHAELLAIRLACSKIKTQQLRNCTIYVTLEPCSMCASAIAVARIKTLIYGTSDPKSGGVENGCCVYNHNQTHHKPEIYSGLCDKEITIMLKSFFVNLRSKKSKL
jgi:tRNA(Arg) A34 adenosine deaminase TadA